MMADDARGNGTAVIVSWQSIIGAMLLIFTMLGAGWSLFQTQFSYIDRDKDLIRSEIGRRENELKEAIKSINIELEQRRAVFVSQTEYQEFRTRISERLNTLEEQNRFLRESRPTTSELVATTNAIRERLSDVEERQKLRPPRTEVESLFKMHDGQMRDSMVALRREIDMFQKEVDRLLAVQIQTTKSTINSGKQ